MDGVPLPNWHVVGSGRGALPGFGPLFHVLGAAKVRGSTGAERTRHSSFRRCKQCISGPRRRNSASEGPEALKCRTTSAVICYFLPRIWHLVGEPVG